MLLNRTSIFRRKNLKFHLEIAQPDNHETMMWTNRSFGGFAFLDVYQLFFWCWLFDGIVVVVGVDRDGDDDDNNKRFFWEIFNVSFSLYLGVIGRWLYELRDLDWYLYRNVDSVWYWWWWWSFLGLSLSCRHECGSSLLSSCSLLRSLAAKRQCGGVSDFERLLSVYLYIENRKLE